MRNSYPSTYSNLKLPQVVYKFYYDNQYVGTITAEKDASAAILRARFALQFKGDQKIFMRIMRSKVFTNGELITD